MLDLRSDLLVSLGLDLLLDPLLDRGRVSRAQRQRHAAFARPDEDLARALIDPQLYRADAGILRGRALGQDRGQTGHDYDPER
jgi:hypothetical protein